MFLLRLLLVVFGGVRSLSRQSGTAPAWFECVPSLIESSPSQVAQGSSQLLGGELGEVSEQTEQQEYPNSKQEDTQEEDEAQRATGRPVHRLWLGQVTAKDRHFLHQQQAAQAEDEDVLGHFVTPPHHVGSEAGGLGLVFMQKQEGLR